MCEETPGRSSAGLVPLALLGLGGMMLRAAGQPGVKQRRQEAAPLPDEEVRGHRAN